MVHSVVGIYDATSGDFIKGIPYVYNGTAWEKVLPKVYISGWKDIGGAGTLFYNFIEHGGNYYNETEHLLVREGNYDRWVGSDGQPIVVTDNKVTTGDPAQAYYVFKHVGGRLTLQDSDSKNLKDSDGRELKVLEDI